MNKPRQAAYIYQFLAEVLQLLVTHVIPQNESLIQIFNILNFLNFFS